MPAVFRVELRLLSTSLIVKPVGVTGFRSPRGSHPQSGDARNTSVRVHRAAGGSGVTGYLGGGAWRAGIGLCDVRLKACPAKSTEDRS